MPTTLLHSVGHAPGPNLRFIVTRVVRPEALHETPERLEGLHQGGGVGEGVGEPRPVGPRAYTLSVLEGDCLVLAMRQDGALRTIEDAVEVRVERGQDTVVDLSIPGWPKAGVGIVIRMQDEGVLVQEILPQGGAADSDLELGDVIVAVGEKSTLQMSLEEFVAAVTGPAETEVTLWVATNGGEPHPVVITRREL